MSLRVLMLDNYDSFTFNIVQYLGELGAEVTTLRNDTQTVAEALAAFPNGRPDRIVVSPGPCSPAEAGISVELIRTVAAMQNPIPLLGVCLGHQSIGAAFGAQVIRAKALMHGKTSAVRHLGKGVFAGLPSPFTVTRYHSLAVLESSLPPELEPLAWTDDADHELMGLRHRDLPIEGVQFHPESILTEHGHALLQNFLQQGHP